MPVTANNPDKQFRRAISLLKIRLLTRQSNRPSLSYQIVALEILAQLRGIACISRARIDLRPAAAHPCAALTRHPIWLPG
jgi:hypothetical protein